jgi:hypothetical protein
MKSKTRQLSFTEPQEKVSDPLLREALATITWSYSRRSTLEQCARRYYYEYFGASKRTAEQEPAKETLHALKGIQNRHKRSGAILHNAIGAYLRKVQANESWSVNGLIAWAQNIFERDIQYSQSHPMGFLSPRPRI